MSENKKQYVPPEILALQQLGRDGKLWTIEVVYNYHNEAKRVRTRNQTDAEVRKYREEMFRYGLTIPIEPGHWQIICPYDIMQVDLYRQSGYFPE